MSIYELNISGEADVKDIDSIKEYLSMIEGEDEVVILGDDSDNLHCVSHMLTENNFFIKSREEIKNGKVYIKATKKK